MNSFINSLLTSSLNPVLRYLNADLDKLKIFNEIKGKAGIYR